MNRLISILLLVMCLFSSTYVLSQSCITMYVKGRHLYSAAGEKVVLRGVNEMFIYSSDIRGVATLPQIAQTGANAVRICWHTNGTAADLDALLANCIANKMIPIVQLDDITGNLGGMQTCLNYWKKTDIIATLNKYKKWVLLNIANEAGDNGVTDAQYLTVYKDAITQLRAVGYTMPFVIDAAGYGQGEGYIINNWAALVQSDPQKNCLFSLHPYWKDTQANIQTRFSTLLTTVVNNNIPFILGEGPQQKGWDCNTTIPYSYIMQQCQTNGIGWLVWTWGKVQDGTNGCANSFDVTTNGNYGSWSNTWGSDIAINDLNSIKKTSVRPASILGGTDTQAPTVPTTLAASAVTANSATLTWAASTDNFGVSSYDVYSGVKLLGNTLANTFVLSGLACKTVFSGITVKAKDCAGNVSAASAAIGFTTATCDTQAPSIPLNLTASNNSLTSTTLSWTASTDNVGVAGYLVYKAGVLVNTTALVSGTSYIVSGLTCGQSNGFTVKAQDAAGNISLVSNTVIATTLACPTGEIVYADALNANWSESAWTWSAVTNLSNTSQKYEGINSIKVDYSGWGGFSARRTAALVPTASTVIKFWVYSTAVNTLNVYTLTDDAGSQSSSVYVNTVANQWKEVAVNMSALGNPAAIKRINIQNYSANAVTVYLDYIRFDSATSSDTQAPSTPTNLTVSNTSQTSTNLSWTASTDNVAVTGYVVYNSSGTAIGTSTTTNFIVTGLNCGTGYSFYVKAKDADNNTSNQSNTVAVSTVACSVPEIVIYDETLNTNWEESAWSWSLMSRDFNNTTFVKSGSKSLKVDYYGWGGLSFRKTTTAHNTTSSTAVKFWAYTTAPTTLQVYTASTDAGNQSSTVQLNLTSNLWVEYTVLLSQLGNPAQIKRINLQNYNANNATVYYDNIRLVGVTGARMGVEENTQSDFATVVFPNPSDGLVNVSYYADKAEKVNLEVVDISGLQTQQQEVQAAAGQNVFSIDMKTSSTGTYFLKMKGEAGTKTMKILIQK